MESGQTLQYNDLVASTFGKREQQLNHYGATNDGPAHDTKRQRIHNSDETHPKIDTILDIISRNDAFKEFASDEFMEKMLRQETPNFHSIDRICDKTYEDMRHFHGFSFFRKRVTELMNHFTVWLKRSDGIITREFIEWNPPEGVDPTTIDFRTRVIDDISDRVELEKYIETNRKLYQIFFKPEKYADQGMSVEAVRLPFSVKTFIAQSLSLIHI